VGQNNFDIFKLFVLLLSLRIGQRGLKIGQKWHKIKEQKQDRNRTKGRDKSRTEEVRQSLC
jgi:hypothetical protein